MMPCGDGCAPDECHGNLTSYRGHIRIQGRTHDGETIDCCMNCLAKIKFLDNKWQTDIVVREWP